MKRVFSILSLMLLLIPCSVTAEQEFYSIRDICEQADKLLEAYGSVGTIEVETTKAAQPSDREYWCSLAYQMAQPVLENMALPFPLLTRFLPLRKTARLEWIRLIIFPPLT